MSRFLNDIRSFSRREKRGVLILIIIIILFAVGGKLIIDSPQNSVWFSKTDSVRIQLIAQNKNKTHELNVTRFDPNTVSKGELQQMNFPSKVIHNIVAFRNAGGKFNTASDVSKIYGIDKELFNKIEWAIDIPGQVFAGSNISESYNNGEIKPDSYIQQKVDPNIASYNELIGSGIPEDVSKNIINYRKAGGSFKTIDEVEKLYSVNEANLHIVKERIEIHVDGIDTNNIQDSIEVNSASYEDFISIGLNSYLAKRLIDYRDLLGGFYSSEQFREIYNIKESQIKFLKSYTWIDSLLITKIEINTTEKDSLAKHPYISALNANRIIKYRDFIGKIKTANELVEGSVLKKSELLKLQNYLSFQ